MTISMRMRSWLRAMAAFVLLCAAADARAILTIEIIGAGANQIPIAIAPFGREGTLQQQLTPIIGADLARSGLFKLVDTAGIPRLPVEPQDVQWGEWKRRNAEVLVIGSVEPLADGRFDVRYRLMDVVREQQLAGFSYNVAAGQMRQTAHRIADLIYEKLTGDPGVFSTSIAYITRNGPRYELHVADADGFGARAMLTSNEPIISPAWSPDGTRLAYVSFEQKKPIIFVQSLATGRRQAVANYKGSNSSPAWSPDGRRLAVVLTKDGSSQIYLVNADGSGLVRLTNSNAIDTEPSFSPDGQSILFTSDRGGSPQVYRVSVSGGQPERMTVEGNYNVTPRYAPDGKSFTYVQRSGGRFNVMVQDVATRAIQNLTDGQVDESPSFAPNGRMILYASQIRGRGILAAVSSDGRIKQRLTVDAGDVREPAWGPLIRSN